MLHSSLLRLIVLFFALSGTAEAGTDVDALMARMTLWNPERVREATRVTAYEARAAAIPWVFAPTAEPGRNPVHSRFYETFDEDTALCQVVVSVRLWCQSRNPS